MAEGEVQIADSDELYRRLPPEHVKADGKVASVTFCFRGQPDPAVSVDLARLTTIEASIARKLGSGLGALVAGVPRALGLRVEHDPILADDPEGRPPNPAHTQILGLTLGDRKRRCYQLAEAVTVLVLPPPRGQG
jgi:hypothetical protein